MDIDIDFKTDFNPLTIVKWTKAMNVVNDEIRAHPCGYYPQNIPVDVLTGLSAIPYKEAEALGFFKIDFFIILNF